MPTSNVALVDGDVAVPPDNAEVPTDVPANEQSPPFEATTVGLHKKNSTSPVGVPLAPDIVTVSIADVSGFSKVPVGAERVVMVGTTDATLLAYPVSVPNLN